MAIYDLIVDKLFIKLEKENRVPALSIEFNQITSDAEKVKFAEKIWRESKIEADIPIRKSKDNERSKELRMQGNQYFSLKNKDNFKALELYNESICFAESDSEDLGIGYANRSAIYFECKKYELCLENIILAREHNYPVRLEEKLNKREAECLECLKSNGENNDGGDNESDDDVFLEPKLSFPPHQKVPFIADCLELQESKELGRYITTNRRLTVGKVIAIEDTFCALILPCVRYHRCANCLNECFLSLIPCPQCTSTMFCCEECMHEAQQNFHQYECPIIDFMFKMLNIIQLSAIRVALRALTSFDSIDVLLKFCRDPDNKKINAFTLEYTDNMPSSELYKPIHTLETNQDKRTTADLFQRAVITAILGRALLEHTELGDVLKNEDQIDLLLELILRHMQTASTNFHRLETLANAKDPKSFDDVSYGSGAYGFCSLINHACSPNIVRLPIGRRIAVFVLRPIDIGEQLLDNYG